MFDSRLDVVPPLGPDTLAEVPAKRGVVLLAGPRDEPIVLLTAADIRARVRNRLREQTPDERKRTTDLRQVTRAVLWKLAASHFENDLNFLELARRVWPRRYERMLAWKPAWFVHVNPRDAYPHFIRTREVLAGAGLHVGPFASGRDAERFIQALQDGFDLCRDYQCLRRSPDASRCAYGQMGKCLSPCDGTISMDDYRSAVAEASRYAAGQRRQVREALAERMRRASAELAFERAARLKTSLERLEELESPEYEHAVAAEEFRFVVVQRGPGTRVAKAFLVDRGHVARAGLLDYPLRDEQLRRLLARMKRFVSAERTIRREHRWCIGLIGRYLFSSDDRRGLILRWTPGMTAELLGEAIIATASVLGVGKQKRHARPGAPREGSESTGARPYNGARSGDGNSSE